MSYFLRQTFDNFGYRLNALSAETFFSDGVFLVEGTSEVLFYTALARELKLDLDRHNISILSVEGVGFKPYVAICNALNISWVLRTDNDIFSKTSVTSVKKYYAGISRGIGIVKDIGDNKTGLIEYWNQHTPCAFLVHQKQCRERKGFLKSIFQEMRGTLLQQ